MQFYSVRGGSGGFFPFSISIPQLKGDGVLGDDRIHVTVDAENKRLGAMVGAAGKKGTPHRMAQSFGARGILRDTHTCPSQNSKQYFVSYNYGPLLLITPFIECIIQLIKPVITDE